jgi:fimbrial chaperone protein
MRMNRRDAAAFSLATLFAPLVHAEQTPLKTAFETARQAGNIDLVLPALRAAQLHVVAGSPGESGDMNDLFYTPSPKKNGRMCITVSEQEQWLASIAWPKRRLSGEAILRRLPAAFEVLIVYPDGGDFLSRESLQWLRSLLR